MRKIIKVTINLPEKIYNDMEEIINQKNSIFNNRSEYIKHAILEFNRKNNEKKSD